MKGQQRKKLVMLEVKSESSRNGGIKEIADCGDVGIAAIQETLAEQPKRLRKG